MDTVLDAVDSGLATSVLEPAHEQDDDTYQFAHALLMDAMMRSVSPARQRLIHRRIADLLAVRTPQAVDQVAAHYARSGDAAQAYTWCRSAAARAMALPGRLRGGLEWYRTLAADHEAALTYKQQPLATPVLGLGGDARFGAQMVPMLKEFAETVTGGAIARCSHYVADERPDEVAAALIGFVAPS